MPTLANRSGASYQYLLAIIPHYFQVASPVGQVFDGQDRAKTSYLACNYYVSRVKYILCILFIEQQANTNIQSQEIIQKCCSSLIIMPQVVKANDEFTNKMQAKQDLSNSQLQLENFLNPKEVQAKQKRLELIFKKAVKDRTVTYFQSVSFKDVEYFNEDFVEIFDITAKKPYICKLKQIIKVPNSLQDVPFLQVEWCLKKDDLPLSFRDIYDDLSQAEIFPSSIKAYLYIESIRAKCTILTLDDYSERPIIPDSFYFTRANYIKEQQIFSPQPSTWKTECICNRPLNPDRSYVQCELCQKWFHCQCAKIADYSSAYTCTKCKAPRKNIKIRW